MKERENEKKRNHIPAPTRATRGLFQRTKKRRKTREREREREQT